MNEVVVLLNKEYFLLQVHVIIFFKLVLTNVLEKIYQFLGIDSQKC